MNLLITKEALAQHPVGKESVYISTEYGFGGIPSLGDFVNLLLPIAFSIAGLMVFFYFIIAAIEMITSQGDKAHIVSARSKIYHAIIGLILLLILYLAVQFIFDTFGLSGLGII